MHVDPELIPVPWVLALGALSVLVAAFLTGEQRTTAKDVMNTVLVSQCFDMLEQSGTSSRSSAILTPHSSGQSRQLTERMRNAMIEPSIRRSDGPRRSGAELEEPLLV